MEPGFPLVDYGISILTEINPRTTKDEIARARRAISDYVTGKITFEEAEGQFKDVRANCSPLEKIKSILACEKDPIPPFSSAISSCAQSSRKKTRTWNSAEDQRLLMGVFKYGTDNWTSIASFVGNGRNRSQCSQRWSRCIDPRVSKRVWTTEEEQKLIQLVRTYGEKSWRKVARELGNRTDVQCRYRFSLLGSAEPLQVTDKDVSVEKKKSEDSAELKSISDELNDRDLNRFLFNCQDLNSPIALAFSSADVGSDQPFDSIFWAM